MKIDLPSIKERNALVFLWILSLVIMTMILLVASALAYQARWSALSPMWKVFENRYPQNALDVRIDAQHVFYIGANRQIASLDEVILAVEERIQNTPIGSAPPTLFLRVAKEVESETLLYFLSRLKGVSFQIGVWDQV